MFAWDSPSRPGCSASRVPAALFRGRALLLVLLSWLQLFHQPVAQSTGCNVTCQGGQLAAVNTLFSALGASREPSASAAVQSPAYCALQGVSCCLSNGKLDRSQGFPSTLEVSCLSPNGIAAILLPSFLNLAGRLPEEVWEPLATSLQYLDLSGNSITGTLPTSMSLLTELKVLDVASNRLQGSLPNQLFANLASVSELVLSGNAFTGSIPPMAAMTSLSYFNVKSNALSGTIPDDWSTSPFLSAFLIRSNKIRGSIPPPGAVNLYREPGCNLQFSAGDNLLTGSLPAGFHMLPLSNLELARNKLSGSLNELNLMPIISEVRLSQNFFSGPIPTAAFQFADVVDLGFNALTGTIPSLVNTPLRVCTLQGNYLSGPLPAITRPTQLAVFAIYNVTNATFDGAQNSRGENLPPYLTFVRGQYTPEGRPHMQCPTVAGSRDVFRQGILVQVDAGFFDFQGCTCSGPYQLYRPEGGVTTCRYVPPPPWKVLVPLYVLGAVLITLVGKYTASLAAHTGGQAVFTLGPDKNSPPEEGQPLTLVVTDVEGSTELWEWDQVTMNEAQALHDQILRRFLRKFHGYEIATEGDSFLVAFHTPTDACAWCLATQQALVSAEWPIKLQQHPGTVIQTYLATAASAPVGLQPAAGPVPGGAPLEHGNAFIKAAPRLAKVPLQQVNPADVLFWGLRVRMSVASGICEKKVVNETNRRQEFEGAVLQVVHSLKDLPHGGQILMDELCFDGIKLKLAELYELVPHGPELEALEVSCRRAGLQVVARALEAPRGPSRLSLLEQSRGSGSGLNLDDEQQEAGRHAPARTGAWKRVCLRMSHLLGESNDPARESTNEPSALLRSESSFRGQHPQRHQDTVCVVDMGMHLLPKVVGARLVVQLLVPGLEERARAVKPLASLHNTAGYFDAPAASACPIRRPLITRLPPVTIVFCAMENLHAMKQANESATEVALMMYRSEVRRLLLEYRGYECSEAGGEHMLAFHSPLAAAHFCLEVQDAMMQHGTGWSKDVLALPGCAPEVAMTGSLIWYGPRVRMGMCEGIPMSVMPHITSGRADYFGPANNRAARFANSAARGGQIMVPLAVAKHLVEQWTGQTLGLEATGSPLQLQYPDFTPRQVVDPLPQAPLLEDHSINLRGPSASRPSLLSTKLRGGAAASMISRGLRGLAPKPASALALATDLEPAGSTDLMLPGGGPDAEGSLQVQLAMYDAGAGGAPGEEAGLEPSSQGSPAQGLGDSMCASPGEPASRRSSLGPQPIHRGALARYRRSSRRWSSKEPSPGAGLARASSEGIVPALGQEAGPRDPGCAVRRSSGLTLQPLHFSSHSTGEEEALQQIFIHHCGMCHFKGVGEPQTVMSLSAGNLALRTFPPSYNSSKATPLAPFKGLQAIIGLLQA